MTATLQLDVVSAEQTLLSTPVRRLTASGSMGDLGIEPGHAPLLSPLQPGGIHLTLTDGSEEIFYVSGGFIEVLPKQVTILADQAIRAHDLDEAAAQEIEREAKAKLNDTNAKLDYSAALAELAAAAAQLRLLKTIRNQRSS